MPSPRPSPTLAPGRHRGRPARVAVTATLLAACSPPRPSPPRPLSPGPAAGERDRRPQPATWPRSGPRRPGCGPPWTSSTGGWRSGAEDLEEAYAQGSSCWPTPPGWTAGAGRLSGSWPSPRPSCTSGPAAPTSPAPAGSCPAWWAPTIRPARPPPPPWSAPAASAPSSRPPASSSSTASPHPLVKGLATEAATAVLAYAFDVLTLPEVLATTDDANKASIHLLTRLGATPTPRVQIGPHTYPSFRIRPPTPTRICSFRAPVAQWIEHLSGWQSTWQSASDDPAAGGATSDHHIRWLGHGR
jgi:hypothetical protein